MECKKIRESILEYSIGDLNQTEKLEFEKHLEECKECGLFFEESREVWNLLDTWSGVEPKEDFITKFWDRVSREDREGRGIVDFFRDWRVRWITPGVVVAILIVSVVLGNFFESKRASVVFTEKDKADEKLLIELDRAISRDTAKSLEVYGPWDEKLQENKGE